MFPKETSKAEEEAAQGRSKKYTFLNTYFHNQGQGEAAISMADCPKGSAGKNDDETE